MRRIYNSVVQIIMVAFVIYFALADDGWYGKVFSALAGILFWTMVIVPLTEHYGFSASKTYRRWYLMCRNVLEEVYNDDHIDPAHAREVLDKIGPRTSKREDWEN